MILNEGEANFAKPLASLCKCFGNTSSGEFFNLESVNKGAKALTENLPDNDFIYIDISKRACEGT